MSGIRAEVVSHYFAGDTLLVPELPALTERYGPPDVALLPINGLRIRTAGNRQVVMNAEEAAELAAALRPKLAVPQHYAFTGGPVGDRFVLKSDKDPARFVEAATRLAPPYRSRSSPRANRSPSHPEHWSWLGLGGSEPARHS
ncbi:MBL fold metallo-hydrolase [Actinoplanes sp. NPDC051851]|uniref:MBL fold metallo-hydrolase n=1 Tax=Actinoplanes sp. NPDC051851 TaxID=3154753 RepID=UPI003444140B